MTPDTVRKTCRFPQRVEGTLRPMWRFYPLRSTAPAWWWDVFFIPELRHFGGCYVIEGRQTPLEEDEVATLRSLLPAVAIAQCTAASIASESTLSPVSDWRFPQ